MSTFGQINLLVRDMAATTEFYRLLELDFADAFEWPAGSGAQHIDDMVGDGAYMAFDNAPMARIWAGGFDADRPAGNVVVGLMVETRDDVDRLVDQVRNAGHDVACEPYDAFFGSRYAIVIDPDGNQVGLKSPIDDDRRYIPDIGHR
ncbi:MAG: VOC family protein [Actinomycetota bacterium]